MIRRIRGAEIAALALLSSCSAQATFVVVSVSTDLAGSTLQLTARVRRSSASVGSGAMAMDSFTVARPAVRSADGIADLGSFTVVPARDARGESVELDVTIASPGLPTLRRRARIAFVAGRGQQARLVLRSRCMAMAMGCTTVSAERCTTATLCEERDQTCGDDGVCVSPTVTTTPIDRTPDAGTALCPDPNRCVAGECLIPVARCVDGLTRCETSVAPAGTQCGLGVCDGAGRCAACGGRDEACCGAACRAGLECRVGRCEPCGGASQPCCGAACLGGLECRAGRCESCGGAGERCCGTNLCSAPRSCAVDNVCR